MVKQGRLRKPFWTYIPLTGIPLFVVLYIIATLYYPGGSQADTLSKGFSWMHNYWCNLLTEPALNGEPNKAKPVVVAGMMVLCIVLSVFWYFFPGSSNVKRWLKLAVRYSGPAAMVCGALIGVFEHDVIIDIASVFGLIAVAGTIYMLNQLGWKALYRHGLMNVLLVGINNLFYYSDGLLQYLPIVQKITFVSVLLWIWLICRKVK